jgi:hypothetical protein
MYVDARQFLFFNELYSEVSDTNIYQRVYLFMYIFYFNATKKYRFIIIQIIERNGFNILLGTTENI